MITIGKIYIDIRGYIYMYVYQDFLSIIYKLSISISAFF